MTSQLSLCQDSLDAAMNQTEFDCNRAHNLTKWKKCAEKIKKKQDNFTLFFLVLFYYYDFSFLGGGGERGLIWAAILPSLLFLPASRFITSPCDHRSNDNDQQPADNGTHDDIILHIRIIFLSRPRWSHWCCLRSCFSKQSLHARDVTINGTRNVRQRPFNDGNQCVFLYDVTGRSWWELQIKC